MSAIRNKGLSSSLEAEKRRPDRLPGLSHNLPRSDSKSKPMVQNEEVSNEMQLQTSGCRKSMVHRKQWLGKGCGDGVQPRRRGCRQTEGLHGVRAHGSQSHSDHTLRLQVKGSNAVFWQDRCEKRSCQGGPRGFLNDSLASPR